MTNLEIKRVIKAGVDSSNAAFRVETILEDGSACFLLMDCATAKSLSSTLFHSCSKVEQGVPPSEKQDGGAQALRPQSLQLGSDAEGSCGLLVLDQGLQSETSYLLDTRLFWDLAQYVKDLVSKMSKEPPQSLN
jgi:hypothetical protein